jgi:hypothetical protein
MGLSKEDRLTIKEAAIAEKAHEKSVRYLLQLAEALQTGDPETIQRLGEWAKTTYPKTYAAIIRIVESRPKQPTLF